MQVRAILDGVRIVEDAEDESASLFVARGTSYDGSICLIVNGVTYEFSAEEMFLACRMVIQETSARPMGGEIQYDEYGFEVD